MLAPVGNLIHLNITAKIWLSIGIFVLGFVFFTVLQHQQGLSTEYRLWETSEILFPAAQDSQKADAFFQRMTKNFSDAVVMQDHNGLVRGHESGAEVVASLRHLAALRPLRAERAGEASRLADTIERLVGDAEAAYGPAIQGPEFLTPGVQKYILALASGTEEDRIALQRLNELLATDLHQQLATLRARSAKLRQVGWIVFATTLLVSTVLVSLTIRHGITTPLLRAEAALAHERESLKTSEASLRLLFQTIPHAVWVYDPKTLEFLLVNDAAVRHYGYSAEEFSRLTVLAILTPEECVRRKEILAHLDPANPPRGAWKHQTKDGRVLDVEVEAGVFEFRERHAVVAVSQDVTERIKLQAELHQAQKLESVGQLAAGIAHEINTPIQYVGDNLRFLSDAFEARQKVVRVFEELHLAAGEQRVTAELLARLQQAIDDADMNYLSEEIPRATTQSLEGVKRVATIVRAMKEFAHPGYKEKAAADLNRALANALIVARNEIKYVADVETDFGELPPVLCHIADLNQVFLNLLINAADAIREVVTPNNQKGVIRVATRQDGNQAIVSISDTGGGIPEEIQTRIFDPFFTTKDVGRGSGQGLAIARATVVEKHGGLIWFEPNGNHGTTFLVALPIESTLSAFTEEEETRAGSRI